MKHTRKRLVRRYKAKRHTKHYYTRKRRVMKGVMKGG